MANAYTAALSGGVPQYYDKLFLERLVPAVQMMDYCIQKPLPANSGTVAYFPRMTASSTTVSAYKIQFSSGYGPISTEAVVAAQISATVEQFGNAKAITDVTKLTAINSTVEEAVREIGDQAGVLLDKRILQEAYGTSAAPTGAGFSAFAFNTVGKADLGASTSAYGTYAGTVEYGMTAATLRAGVKKLMANNVKPFDDGLFAFVMHTNSAFAIQADTQWQTAYQYTDPENMRKGITGSYAGAKVVIDNNVFTSANGSSGATLYYSVLLGRSALGVTELDGGVKFYTTSSGADKFDPIDQFITIGWKANMVPVRLNLSSGIVVVTAD